MSENDTPAEEAGETSRYPFRLGGEEFATIDRAPKWASMKLASAYKSRELVTQMAGMYDFMTAVLLPEEADRFGEAFDALPDDDDGVEALDEAIGTWIGSLANRPKETPSPSSSGSTTPTTETKEPSRVVSLSPGGPGRAETTSSVG